MIPSASSTATITDSTRRRWIRRIRLTSGASRNDSSTAKRDRDQHGAAKIEAGDDDHADGQRQQTAQARRFGRRHRDGQPHGHPSSSAMRSASYITHLSTPSRAPRSDQLVISPGQQARLSSSRARRPAASEVALITASRKPPGGIEWCAGSRSSWNVICTLETPSIAGPARQPRRADGDTPDRAARTARHCSHRPDRSRRTPIPRSAYRRTSAAIHPGP